MDGIKETMEGTLRFDEPVKIVPKGWGEERWIHNDEKYCGKLLVLKQGKHCSLHYHKLKHETFYIVKGRLSMELTDLAGAQCTPPEIREQFEMVAGDAIFVTPGLVHRFSGLEPETHIMEFSTQHFDSDSHRVVKGD